MGQQWASKWLVSPKRMSVCLRMFYVCEPLAEIMVFELYAKG